jgi:hypothetical protein
MNGVCTIDGICTPWTKLEVSIHRNKVSRSWSNSSVNTVCARIPAFTPAHQIWINKCIYSCMHSYIKMSIFCWATCLLDGTCTPYTQLEVFIHRNKVWHSWSNSSVNTVYARIPAFTPAHQIWINKCIYSCMHSYIKMSIFCWATCLLDGTCTPYTQLEVFIHRNDTWSSNNQDDARTCWFYHSIGDCAAYCWFKQSTDLSKTCHLMYCIVLPPSH